jgi:hypothetical protein
MAEESIVHQDGYALVKRTEGLAKRGLGMIDEYQISETIFSGKDIIRFILKYRLLLESIEEFPKEFLNHETENPHDLVAFDLNRFLTAFDQIKIRDGYVLDYVYSGDHYSGQPYIYVREYDAIPINTSKEFREKYQNSFPFKIYLEFTNTPLGVFQFAFFCMTVNRFYLYWHSNYNDRKFILTQQALDIYIEKRIGYISTEDSDLLRTIDPRPRVQLNNKTGRVFLLNYEVNMGYSRLEIVLKHPNIFVTSHDEVIIKNHTTLLY